MQPLFEGFYHCPGFFVPEFPALFLGILLIAAVPFYLEQLVEVLDSLHCRSGIIQLGTLSSFRTLILLPCPCTSLQYRIPSVQSSLLRTAYAAPGLTAIRYPVWYDQAEQGLVLP